jgi:2'-hydroxyisoflavone reductase
MITRREFLERTAMASAALGLACAPSDDDSREEAPVSPKRLLILGGTGFIGPNTVRYAVERGHQVTIFTRGRRDPSLPEGVEHLTGDRNDDHSALEGRTWDVVLDNNAQDYRWVQRSTALLRDAAEQYVFVSSISAYAADDLGWSRAMEIVRVPSIDEDYARWQPPAGWQDGDPADYGLMKSLSEDIVHEAFPNGATIVRPGLIVGPGDTTDRFGYWPVRMDEGGEVLAPGNPEHAMQIIDQRDLTEWIVRLAESGTTGDFNAVGPADRLSMGSMLGQISDVIATPHTLTWVPESFLERQGLTPWTDIPAWSPGDPLFYVDVRDAVAAGLAFRPIGTTARDTLEWDKTRPAEARARRQFGMSREREREVLAAWHAA